MDQVRRIEAALNVEEPVVPVPRHLGIHRKICAGNEIVAELLPSGAGVTKDPETEDLSLVARAPADQNAVAVRVGVNVAVFVAVLVWASTDLNFTASGRNCDFPLNEVLVRCPGTTRVREMTAMADKMRILLLIKFGLQSLILQKLQHSYSPDLLY